MLKNLQIYRMSIDFRKLFGKSSDAEVARDTHSDTKVRAQASAILETLSSWMLFILPTSLIGLQRLLLRLVGMYMVLPFEVIERVYRRLGDTFYLLNCLVSRACIVSGYNLVKCNIYAVC